ncbi:MAG: methyltransferase [Pseudomonadota bacterium]
MNLRDRLLNWRNDVLSNPAFQDWAATFPLTQFIARRRARAIFDMTAGFVYSQILYACVVLGVLESLRQGPLSTQALSAKINLPLDGTLRLVRAAASLGLLERYSQSRFGLGKHGAALMGNAAVTEMIRHHAILYDDLRDPVALLRERSTKTKLAAFWNYEGVGGDEAGNASDSSLYSDLMAQTQAFIVSEILQAYSFTRHSHLMDVGGGSGAFLSAVGKKAPELKLTLCDLPPVAAAARRRFARDELENRAQAVACNILSDSLPTGADVISLVRVLHDHDDMQAESILSAIWQALPHQGTLMIAEPMAETPGAEPMGDAYFGLYLWAMGSGRPRSRNEISQLLRDVGFRRIRSMKTRRPILTQILVAQRA